MEEIEEKFLKIGAKVLNEYFTHGRSVEVTIGRSKTDGAFEVDVDVHPVTFFGEDEMDEVKYRATRADLPEEGKKQLDDMWEKEQEIKKREEVLDRLYQEKITIKQASMILNLPKKEVQRLVDDHKLVISKKEEEI